MANPTIFLNESYKNKEGRCGLYLALYLNNKIIRIKLNVFVEPQNFDSSKNIIANNKKDTLILNEALGRASDIILKYRVNKKDLTKERFIKEFSNPSVFMNFYDFMEDEIKLRTGIITDTSKKQHLSVLNSMKSFKKELFFSEFTEDFLEGYRRFLIKRNLKKNTIHHKFKTIKTYTLKAFKKGLINKNPFSYFSFKKELTHSVFLTELELEKFIELYNSDDLTKLKPVLRWFLFSCHTGLRISDFMNLKNGNFDGFKISFKPIKTENINNNKITILLGDLAIKLIREENSTTEYLFNSFTEQVINRKLKEIAKVLKINKNITFHTARHTFATSFLMKQNKASDIVVLQRILGHQNILTTMKYLHMTNIDIDEGMRAFNEKIK